MPSLDSWVANVVINPSVELQGPWVWVPANLLQAEDRAHRIGQVNPVNVRYLCAAGTLDDIVWPAVKRKLETLVGRCRLTLSNPS
jgi:hypothetical protein